MLGWGHRPRAAAGLSEGRIVCGGSGAWERCERPLFSQRYRASGQPDHLVEDRRRTVAVGVKPSRQLHEPYEQHSLQLAACYSLLEEEDGQRPRHGYMKYSRAAGLIES